MRRIVFRVMGVLAPVALIVPVLGGCSAGVSDTGYQPNHLGLSDAQRRGLYAPKYSPEQAQAQAERDAELRRRGGTLSPTPGSGY